MKRTLLLFGCCISAATLHSDQLVAQNLEQRLLAEDPQALVAAAQSDGDPRRGAVVFHSTFVGCAKCHSVSAAGENSLPGPDLATIGQSDAVPSNVHVVESILQPSRVIRKGFETSTVVRNDGTVITGVNVKQDAAGMVIRDASSARLLTIPAEQIEDVVASQQSIMPQGVVNQLAGRQQFLDLVRYVFEVRDGGVARAEELQPPPSLVAFQVPEYEARVDHARLLTELDQAAYERGEAIYSRLCINCHGTLETPGSLPTALRFAEGKFKNGSDPFAMYQTLTHGFGLMNPQTWMVPRQKYDVIHYIREALLRPHNPSQYRALADDYLASLPKGDTAGPEPTEFSPWSDMNYGPWMFNTVEIGRDGSNIAYKGLAVRLDPGPGGVSRGNQWLLFDHDTMRVAGIWSHVEGTEGRFIDWQGIHFDGRHQAHPHAVGRTLLTNPTGPGWADPASGEFADEQRVVGRDGKRYGPLPRSWAQYHGMHHTGDSVIVSYSVGDMSVLEEFGAMSGSPAAVVRRTLHLGPSSAPQHLLVATAEEANVDLLQDDTASVTFGVSADTAEQGNAAKAAGGSFDGTAWLESRHADICDTTTGDFTLTARIRTREDGVIFCRTAAAKDEWVPDGTVLFIRNGRLCYDIGWVGVIESRKRIADGKWHDVAVTWDAERGTARLYVDGRQQSDRALAPKNHLQGAVIRIGFGTSNFPKRSAFRGDIRDVRFFNGIQPDLNPQELAARGGEAAAVWLSDDAAGDPAVAATSVQVLQTDARASDRTNRLRAGYVGETDGLRFEQQGRRLVLAIPPSTQARSFTLWLADAADQSDNSETDRPLAWDAIHEQVAAAHAGAPPLPDRLQQPARPLWPEILTTNVSRTPTNASGFSVDVLTAPDPNPWLARLRFSGHDFYPDGNRMVVCSWDGDVYEVSGIAALESEQASPVLKWKRIASGLFQPLGVKLVGETVYLTCRDQIVVLRDHNGDGATDVFECFNNDQQVTEHFHEFAMGLQRDDAGNLYYAKSARHALTALVPHHGTLLRVSPDGERTDILANGFRAANGVCLNPDGSFIVTDQEGHWNPKNRINWVTEGGFYGNMFGYHDVTDESDEAMQQPLCWITNAFDRSPSELLWVDSPRWGQLNGALLNLSYGYGKIYTVPFQQLSGTGRVQGGMCEFPLPQFPTGTMRGRFHPQDGQLYLSGLFAWGSNQQARDGGLYRVSYDGNDATMPVGIRAAPQTLSVTFSDPIDVAAASDPSRYKYKAWSLKRTRNYGSKHYDEHELSVTAAAVAEDGRTVVLTLPELAPTWCYELRCRLVSHDGRSLERVIHGTIHELVE